MEAGLNNIDSIVHQVGRGDANLVSQHYLSSLKDSGITYTVVPFIENMGKEFANCDIVISRSGASTVSEICACGVASILVPYPYAVDDHQKFNAQPLANCGAAHLLLQSELSVDLLTSVLANLDRNKCIDMAIKARKLGIRDSTVQICQHITEIIKEDD